MHRILVYTLASCLTFGLVSAAGSRDWRRTELKGNEPSGAVLRQDIDGDGQPDIVERWWNRKRVRWLDENRDLRPDDARGDQIADVLQIDMDGDGWYDGPSDMNIKWVDRDGDRVPDVQVFAHNPKSLAPGQGWDGHWMLFINHDKRGVLGWMDWSTWDFDCWGYSDRCNWLPNYHDGDFVKIHQGPGAIQDPRLNWENPFSFFDEDGDGLSEMALRWCSPYQVKGDGTVAIEDRFNEAYLTYDLDNDSTKGNESDYDLTLRAGGLSTLRYGASKQRIEGLRGDPRFDACFQFNQWRRIDEVVYLPRDKQYDAFFDYGATTMILTFDEDDDDHRWERVEMLYPTDNKDAGKAVDPWSTLHPATHTWKNPDASKPLGLASHCQADTLGDRGEFDRDNSGQGKLYIGPFDRKLHLLGAEWGAWTVDRQGAYHAGWKAPSPRPAADKVQEVVRYTDTDGNGFIDRIEYDYDGDRTPDFIMDLLAWKSPENPHPDVAAVLDPRTLGWKGLHERFQAMAEQSWQEALAFYRAMWRRGLCEDAMDRLAVASSYGERYDHAYWLKESLLRAVRAILAETGRHQPAQAEAMRILDRDLLKAAYLGRWDEVVKLTERIPSR